MVVVALFIFWARYVLVMSWEFLWFLSEINNRPNNRWLVAWPLPPTQSNIDNWHDEPYRRHILNIPKGSVARWGNYRCELVSLWLHCYRQVVARGQHSSTPHPALQESLKIPDDPQKFGILRGYKVVNIVIEGDMFWEAKQSNIRSTKNIWF